MIPIPFFSLCDYFIDMSLKDNFESSVRLKYFCSLTFGITDSYKKIVVL